MSGLAVVFHRDQRPVPRRAVQAMLDAVPYRGPDGNSIHLVGPLALGHAAFTVTPQDVGQHQPLLSPRTGCALIVDARLDNRADLLARLPDPPPPTASDAELILRAYEAWQLDAPRRLLGDFAFVLWDPRHQRLVCARDTSGQRSLFYRSDARTFAAASEIHQLFQDPSVPIAPNEDRIRESLVPFHMRRNEADLAPSTFYTGVHALPAGHVLVVTAESQQTWRYWDLQPQPELRYRSDDEYAEHYLALLQQVVGARLRTGHRLGALLSGGLDSSSVVCTAMELINAGRARTPGLTTFSLVYPGLDCDEQQYIADVQARYDLDARCIPFPRVGGWLQPAPTGFLEAPNMGVRESRDAICSAATQAGVRAMLTGDVADSCVGGSPLVFDSLLRHGQLAAYLRLLRVYRRTSGEPLRTILIDHTLGPLLPLPLQKAIDELYLRRRFARDASRLLPFWLADNLRAELAQRHFGLALRAERERRFSNPTRHWEHGLLYPPEAWRHPTPWPVEFWRPFADRRLHEFLLAIPPQQKFEVQPGSDEFYAASKQLARRALRGILPERIRSRQIKTHFGSELVEAVRHQWTDYVATFGPAARPEVSQRGYVNQQRLWERLERLRAGGNGNDAMYLVHIVGLETWLRTFRLRRADLLRVPAPSATRAAA